MNMVVSMKYWVCWFTDHSDMIGRIFFKKMLSTYFVCRILRIILHSRLIIMEANTTNPDQRLFLREQSDLGMDATEETAGDNYRE